MATKNHNLSKFDSPLPSAADMRFGIVVAEWNREVTEALLEGAVCALPVAKTKPEKDPVFILGCWREPCARCVPQGAPT